MVSVKSQFKTPTFIPSSVKNYEPSNPVPVATENSKEGWQGVDHRVKHPYSVVGPDSDDVERDLGVSRRDYEPAPRTNRGTTSFPRSKKTSSKCSSFNLRNFWLSAKSMGNTQSRPRPPKVQQERLPVKCKEKGRRSVWISKSQSVFQLS